jgi:hypothetical protein
MAPSSYGEALDRLTILDLKLEFIQDKRREDVQREHADLKELVRDMLIRDSFHYEKLLEVNRIMWMIQDILHSGKLNDKEAEYNLMKQLAVENQRRFRLKRTMNEFLGSHQKEQKGYKGKRCLVVGHQGMGDHLFINGGIRFLATHFDEVCVVVKQQYLDNLKILYANESAVTLHPITTDAELSPAYGADSVEFGKFASTFDIDYMLGYHGGNSVVDFPLSFYDDFKMDRSVMMEWSYLPSTKPVDDLPPFVFYHAKASNAVAQIPINLEEKLVINPSENMYPEGHRWHSLVQSWVGLPFFEYTDILRKADQIFVVDSSFFCMSLLLKRKPEVWSRNGRTYRNVVPDLIEHTF